MERPDLIRELLSSPFAKELVRKDEERVTAERQELGKKLAALDREHATTFPQLRQALDTAERAVVEARSALRDAEATLAAAWQAQVSASLHHANARSDVEAKLKESADPRIGEFVAVRRAEMDAVRRGDDSLEVGARRMVALRWAITEAEKLALVPDADITASLARITEHLRLEVAA